MSNIGHIYKLICSETGKLYIGSTIQTLQQRLWKHRSKSNRCVSRDFINPTIELIESIEYTDYEKLLWRERFHIDTEECINKLIPISTKEEKKTKDREYDIKNKDKIKERKQKYYLKVKENLKEKYENNKEEICKKRREKINCECGGKYQHTSRARHFKTKLHQGWIAMKFESK